MGMFDTVKCYYSEMEDGHSDLEFQTKDLECLMDYYVLDKDGSLFIEEYDVEDKSDPNAEGLARIIGCMSKTNEKLVRSDLTDTFTMYAKDEGDEEWIVYKVQVTRGQLTYFERINDT
jgi:hypothetical protein